MAGLQHLVLIELNVGGDRGLEGVGLDGDLLGRLGGSSRDDQLVN